MSDLAQQLIEREKRDRTGTLDLGNCGLTELPDLSELDWLETLIVSNKWWDWENRKWVNSQNTGKSNRIASPPARSLPKSLKKMIFGGDNRVKWIISDWSFLEKLTNLTTLSLRSNQISDGAFLGKLANLTMLSLGSNQIRDESFLEKLANLTSLDLGDNNISNGSFLENLVNLKTLDLSSNKISDVAFLENLVNLKTLDLSSNQISDVFFFANLTKMNSLDLGFNQISDGAFLEKLTNLTSLDLRYNQISNVAFLGTLTNLTTLNISNNQIEDLSPILHLVKKGIPVVWNQRDINEICVEDNPLTNLPREIIEKGNEAILEYFQQKATQGARRLLGMPMPAEADLAQQLIEREKRDRTGYLDLGNCGLTELPDLSELDWLETLIVSNKWWDWENRKWVNSQNTGKSNRIASPPARSLPESLKKMIFGGDNRVKWTISDWSFLEKLTNLTTLSLRSNQISDGAFLGKLANLTMLSFGSNQIRDESFLEKLANLTSLDLGDNNINDGSFLENLINLTALDLRYNQISDVAFLENLVNLKTLDLSSNQISDVFFFANLTKMNSLDLGFNQISDGAFLEKLTNLTSLDLRYNQISNVAFLGTLTNLTTLNISNNQIEDLSPILHLVKKGIPVVWNQRDINEICVEDNPLTNPPREIIEKGNEAILRHWRNIAEQGAETINEAKLIIVGEGNTGKTTLFNKLIDPDYDLEKNPTTETHGINVHEGLEITSGFRANLWDFGGQDLQYMTHQFFLTPRALYVLVMEARSGSPNLPYWFRIISLLGKSSPDERVSLLLVLNKRKGGTGRPQYGDLMKIYEDDFDFETFEVDFAENDKRWECLHEAIVRLLGDLPIVKNLLPKKWQSIREALRTESENRPYISTERLHEICSEYNVTEEADQWQMTDYLHQLGSLLHFQNDPDLLDTVVLRPSWAVDGVYTTLKSDLIKTRNGKFSQEDIFHILRSSGYKNTDAQKILKLMSKHNFDICYQSKSGNHYVAAQLLEPDRPALFKWHTHTGALQFRYQYAIMPKGLMSRLIVRLSDYIEVLDGTEIVWEKGAILQIPRNNSVCRVMMFEDEDSKSGLKQIAIEVLEDDDRRANRKFALQQVRDEVEDLHRRWFQNIQFEQIIPCNCERCRISAKPFTFLLSELQRLTKGKAFCNDLEDFVPLIQLLEGVYKQEEIQAITHNRRNHRLHAEGMEFHFNIENSPHFTVTNQNSNVNQSDLTALEKMLGQLAADKKEALKNYVEMLPEAETPEEKIGLGKSIAKWLDKNAEGIAVNVSASVYYDALKFLFGI